ncbi:hypothetical protein [Pedobacter jeongneungensis]|uniref:hypothetical protein n=1 Tax=Pedobacter jeongneungensis TaxID=947309 RepID=UPI0031D70862
METDSTEPDIDRGKGSFRKAGCSSIYYLFAAVDTKMLGGNIFLKKNKNRATFLMVVLINDYL